MEPSAKKSVLMIIAPANFRDEELFEPKSAFESRGLHVTVASKGVKTAKGKLGASVEVDKDISAVNIDYYDAIVFVGGPGASAYFEDNEVLSIAKEAYKQGKIVAAICAAPSILANAGILSGKKATCTEGEALHIKSQGAVYTGADLESDGNIITADGPWSAKKFGIAVADAVIRGA